MSYNERCKISIMNNCFIAFVIAMSITLIVENTGIVKYKDSHSFMLLAFILLSAVFLTVSFLKNTKKEYKDILEKRMSYKWKKARYKDVERIIKNHMIDGNRHYMIQDDEIVYSNGEQAMDPEEDEIEIEEVYSHDLIYDHGVIYILSYMDYIRYRRLHCTFIKKMEKKQENDMREDEEKFWKEKTEKLVRRNEVS